MASEKNSETGGCDGGLIFADALTMFTDQNRDEWPELARKVAGRICDDAAFDAFHTWMPQEVRESSVGMACDLIAAERTRLYARAAMPQIPAEALAVAQPATGQTLM